MTEKEIQQTSYSITFTKFSEKWSEYYICKGCENEVKRKCYLTKPEEAVHAENVRIVSSKTQSTIILLKSKEELK